MFRNIVSAVLIFSMMLLACGCYSLQPYSPRQAKPEWEVAEVVTIDNGLVRFDEPGNVDGPWVVGGIRNDFYELKSRAIPLDSVREIRVREFHWNASNLIAAGVGAGIAAFVVIMISDQHRAKSPEGAQAISDTR
jgi:hypothetical protein